MADVILKGPKGNNITYDNIHNVVLDDSSGEEEEIIFSDGTYYVDVSPLDVDENGTYEAPSGQAYNPITVGVPETTDFGTLVVGANGVYPSGSLEGYSEVQVTCPQLIRGKVAQIVDKSVTSITEEDLSGVTSLRDYVFRSCINLSEVTIPDTVTSIGDYAFNNCQSLSTINIPDSVTSIGNFAFSNCDALSTVTLPSSIISISNSLFSSCDSLSSFSIPSSVTTIGSGAFQACTSLGELTIPSSVTTIGKEAFRGASITSLVIPETVTSLGDSVCYGLKGNSITFKTETVPASACRTSSVTSVVVENATSVGSYAFRDCSNLSSLVLPATVTSMGQSILSGSNSLSHLTVHSGISRLSLNPVFSGAAPTTIVYIHIDDLEDYLAHSIAFQYLPKNNSRFYFMNGEEISSVQIPSTVQSLQGYAFYRGIDITSVDFSVATSLIGIGYYAFYGCNLVSVDLPESVRSIFDYAFYGCNSLRTVTIRNSSQVLQYYTNMLPTGAYSVLEHIYVPANLVDSYKSASGWSSLASKISAISE